MSSTLPQGPDSPSRPYRWAEVKSLFLEALDHAPADRAIYLDEACGGDQVLREQTDALLAAADRAESFLESPAVGSVSPQTFVQDEVVGPYRLIREIGIGGMGAVYLACRADDSYRQEVALKIVRPGLHMPEVVRRFRRERQALANLVHPNIARLLDGGSTDRGLPYFVMDYVDGIPIDEYCDQHRLGIGDRVRLFRIVCAAVHCAHQNLIVHRDLKPDNILVTPEGVPKLVDFGIAKLLGPDPEALESTEEGMSPMTLRYASPEQVAGSGVTTSTDLYSLGVVLYELLTGHLPYRLGGYRKEDLEHAISGQEPERPSTAVTRGETARSTRGATVHITPGHVSAVRGESPLRLRRRLTGDLDTILLMALRKDPARRYGSVQQFDEDLRRYLEGLPVIARPDTLAYRTRKFLGRHGVAVAAVTSTILALSGGMTWAIWEARVADAERHKAERTSAFLLDMFASVDVGWFASRQALTGNVTALDLLRRAGQQIETRLTGVPDVQASMHRRLGASYHALGLYGAAEPHLRTALALHRRVYGPSHIEIADSLHELASLLMYRGAYREAEGQFRESLQMQRAIGATGTTLEVKVLLGLGSVLWRYGELELAEPPLTDARTAAVRLPAGGGDMTGVALDLLGHLQEDRGDFAGAEQLYRESLGLLRDPTMPGAVYAIDLGVLLGMQGRFAEGEPLIQQGIALQRKLAGDAHPWVGLAIARLGETQARQGLQHEAMGTLAQGLEVLRKALGDSHGNLARPLLVVGELHLSAGRLEESEQVFRQGLTIAEASLSPRHWTRIALANALRTVRVARWHDPEAQQVLTTSYEQLRRQLGEQHPVTRAAHGRLVAGLLRAGEDPSHP